MRLFLSLLVGVVAAVLAAGGVIGDALYGWSRAPIAPRGDTQAFLSAARDELKERSIGNVAFILLDGGEVAGNLFLSKGAPVDADTQFQVASLSKFVSAWGVMTLVERGLVDLDAPVSTYLTRWSLPEGEFDNDAVTVRRLLSHTAGLTDGLGYKGFLLGEPLQSLEASLTNAADASPGADPLVRVGQAPGDGFQYSGGGYTLLQLIVEEVTNTSFNDYMKDAVFQPLGMVRSTYILKEGAENVAEFYDEEGAIAPHYRFTSLAATSLYTSAGDMARFVQAHLPASDGELPGRGVLGASLLQEMREPHAHSMGAAIWGLGVMLFAPASHGGFVIGHDGDNEPAINTAVRFDPETGDGIVILETGTKLLATDIASEWVFWQTGNVDFLDVTREMKSTLTRLIIFATAAFFVFSFLTWRMSVRRS